MMKNSKLFIALLFLAFLAAAFAFARPTSAGASAQGAPPPQQQTPPSGAAEARRELTPQERRGKAIYLRGESPSGREIEATIGDVSVPSSTVTCGGCHGLRAEGKTEGGITAGNLTWSNLLKPHTHPSGRKHRPFDLASFVRAVVGGIDPEGNQLAAAMPRFRMSNDDMADLVAYLRRIETETDPGLSETSIRVGTVLPQKGALGDVGAAMRDVLTAYFEDLNSRGGIYNRRVELRVAEMGADAAATSASIRRLIEQEQVFAFVGGMSAGVDRELAALASETETPFIGPATLLPQSTTPVNRYIFYLLPGLGEQARALVNFAAARPETKKGRVVVIYPEGEVAAATVASVEEQAQKAGLGAVIKQPYARAAFDARQLVQKLKGENGDALFFLSTSGEETALIREAAAAGWTPSVFLLGALTGRDLTQNVPVSFKERVFLAFPTVPSDITPQGVAEFRALQEKYKIAPRHTASQLATFAAAKIFVEGLRRSGKELSREKLITALEGLYDFETGLTPHITFGPNRRIGAAGANVLKVDPEKREFAPAGGWVKAY